MLITLLIIAWVLPSFIIGCTIVRSEYLSAKECYSSWSFTWGEVLRFILTMLLGWVFAFWWMLEYGDDWSIFTIKFDHPKTDDKQNPPQ